MTARLEGTYRTIFRDQTLDPDSALVPVGAVQTLDRDSDLEAPDMGSETVAKKVAEKGPEKGPEKVAEKESETGPETGLETGAEMRGHLLAPNAAAAGG